MEEENGLSLVEICKVILKRIWWVVGAAALGVILVVLVTQLWYNKAKQTFSVTYDVVFPNGENGKYPDGSDFLIGDMISLETLTAIKESNVSFANIDVEKMVSEDDISIVRVYDKDAVNEIFFRTFRLEIVARYFKDDEQAVDFMQAISDYPINRVNEVIEDYDYGVYFRTYDNAATYQEKIDALVSQKNYIIASYNQLSDYGNEVELNLASLGNIFTSQDQKYLNNELETKLYIYNTNRYIDEYQTTRDALMKQIDENNNIITALKKERDEFYGSTSSSTDKEMYNAYDEKIADYTVTNEKLWNEVKELDDTYEEIGKYLTEGSAEYTAKQKFDSRLAGYRSELEEATATMKAVRKDIYYKNSRVVYSGNKVKREGGMGAIMGALIGAILGLVISACVVLIIDLPKYKREKLALQTAGASEDNGTDVSGGVAADAQVSQATDGQPQDKSKK